LQIGGAGADNPGVRKAEWPLILLALSLATAGCGKAVGSGALPRIILLHGTPAPTPPIPHNPTPAASPSIERYPLRDLSAATSAYLADRSGAVGVAVAVPSQRAIYTTNGDTQFPLASVVKVAIMVTALDQATKSGRDLDSSELDLLDRMITVSDNDATTALWTRVGGGAAIQACLESHGLSDFHFDAGNEWGASTASPRAVALLLNTLAAGQILDATSTTLALNLMSRVIPDQSWGITAGLPRFGEEGADVGIKDGWYPSDDGWWVNSVGVVRQLAGEPAYTIAVLTNGQPSLDYGIETIEWVAALVQASIQDLWPAARVADAW
jgi:hypothetical protein